MELDLNNEIAAQAFKTAYPHQGDDPLHGFTKLGIQEALNRYFRHCDEQLAENGVFANGTYYQRCEYVLRGLIWGLHAHGAELARVLVAHPERQTELLFAYEYRRDVTTWHSQSLMNEVLGIPTKEDTLVTYDEHWDSFIEGLIKAYDHPADRVDRETKVELISRRS